MKNLKLAIFIALFINSVVYASSEKLPDNTKELVCHQMTLIGKSAETYAPYLWYAFRYKDYKIRYEYKIIDVYKSKTTSSYEISENNISSKKLTIKNVASADFTNANLCEDSQKNHYFVLEQGEYESEEDDGRSLTGKMIEIISDSNENNKPKYFSGIFYDQYLKGVEKLKSQYKIISGHTPEILLKQDKYLPINFTMYEKDGGLYFKVGSTYKANVLTLKKPTVISYISASTKQDLIQTIRDKDDNATKALIEKGVDVNTTDKYGATPLIVAIFYGNFEVAKLLTQKNADMNAKDISGYTPLILAILNNNTEFSKILIQNGTDVNATTKYGYTPLIFATLNNNIELVELLIQNGADINAKDKDGDTPLMHASFNGKTEIAKILISKGANVKAKTEYGSTSLSNACSKNHIALAKLLIQNGADVNTKDQYGNTSLLWTCRMGYTKLAKLLIEKGANVNAKDYDGNTPLLYASGNNNSIELIKLLLEKGANINTKDNYSHTPLMMASNINYTAAAILLAQKGADVNANDGYGSALSYACRHNSIELAKLLIAKGAKKTEECDKLFKK